MDLWSMAEPMEIVLRKALAGDPQWRKEAETIMDVLDGRAQRLHVTVIAWWHKGPAGIRDEKLRECFAAMEKILNATETRVSVDANGCEAKFEGFVYPDGTAAILPERNAAEKAKNTE
jgi:hypothetical protein